MSYFFPPLVILVGLILYQVSQKSVDKEANPFLVVIVAYVIGIVACLIGYFALPKSVEPESLVKNLGWPAIGIGLGAAAIEVGFVLAYRAGWNVSILPLSVNVVSALALIVIGLYAFRESLSIEKVIGICLCIGGLALITLRK